MQFAAAACAKKKIVMTVNGYDHCYDDDYDGESELSARRGDNLDSDDCNHIGQNVVAAFAVAAAVRPAAGGGGEGGGVRGEET